MLNNKNILKDKEHYKNKNDNNKIYSPAMRKREKKH